MLEILDLLKGTKTQLLTSKGPEFHFRCSIGPLNYFSFQFLNANLKILKNFETTYCSSKVTTICSLRIWFLIEQNNWNESFRCFFRKSGKKEDSDMFFCLVLFLCGCPISFSLHTMICIQMGMSFSPQDAILFSTSGYWDEILHIQLKSCCHLQASHALNYAHLAEAECLQTRTSGWEFLWSVYAQLWVFFFRGEEWMKGSSCFSLSFLKGN